MKLSHFAPVKFSAVLVAALALLGCELPATEANQESPPVYPAVAGAPQAPLVTVTNPVANTGSNAVASPVPALEPEAQETLAKPVALSDRLQEVVKLAQSGVGDDVILAFIQNAPAPFNPTPEEIVYLTDLGLSDVIVTALVNHHVNQAPEPPQTPPPAALPPPTGSVPPPGQAPFIAGGAPDATYNPEPQVVYSPAPVVQYVAPQPAVEYNYFYSSLSPYGAWVNEADYGWCWQPTVAVMHHGWMPYCDRGRWLSTDCGMYWQSDYSWGWAPFHYGRWFSHPVRGWCWRPDSVWAPSWVAWRYTDSHCGWAPLPPGAHYRAGVGFTYYGANVGVSFGFGLHHDAWTFVPGERFHDREVWRHRAGPRESGNMYSHSRVINNYVVNNNTVINQGIGADRVHSLRQAETRQVSIRELPERGAGNIRPDRLHQDGSEVVVYRPKPPVSSQHGVRAVDPVSSRPVYSQPSTAGAGGAARLTEGRAPTVSSGARGQGQAPPANIVGSRPVGSPSGVGPSRQPYGVESTRPASESRPGSAPVASSGLTTRQEGPKAASVGPSYSTPAVASPSWNQVRPSSGTAGTPSGQAAPRFGAPTTVSPAPIYRAERSFSTTPASPDRYSATAPSSVAGPSRIEAAPASRSFPSSAPSVAPSSQPSQSRGSLAPGVQYRPAPSYSGPGPVRTAPSYSPPVQSRPAPSYSAPSVQSRPAPSYSAPAAAPRAAPSAPSFAPPASRPAPQSAPAAVRTDRSTTRRE